jgi:hypothetical protein
VAKNNHKGRVLIGRERDAPSIPLFDHTRKRKSRGRDIVALTAPKAMYESKRYEDAVHRIEKRHPGSIFIFPDGLYHTETYWRRTFRTNLHHVTHAYSLVTETGVIGAGAFAELVFLNREDSSLRFCGAFTGHPRNPSKSVLQVRGAFQPNRQTWWWTQAARLEAA